MIKLLIKQALVLYIGISIFAIFGLGIAMVIGFMFIQETVMMSFIKRVLQRLKKNRKDYNNYAELLQEDRKIHLEISQLSDRQYEIRKFMLELEEKYKD